MKKVALWELLVQRGYFASRDDATRWILAGDVICGELRIDKAGTRVPVDSEIRVRGMGERFVGRGGYKLEAALDAFAVDVTGRVALDAGASTGGFTHCLLQRGATTVYAVDVGFGQLSGTLRADSRVVVMERTNLGEPSLQSLSPRPDIVTLDLSYLSLTIAIPIAAGITGDQGLIVCLVKPLFEVDDSSARSSGRDVTDDEVHRIVDRLVRSAKASGFDAFGLIASPILGTHGTREFLIGLVRGKPEMLNGQVAPLTHDDVALALKDSASAARGPR